MATGRYLDEIIKNCDFIMGILVNNKEDIIEKLRPVDEIDEGFDISNFVV